MPEMEPPKRIFLIGYRGTGKSAVGAVLAKRLGWAHCDSDRLIETKAAKSITEIFKTDGEEAFRLLESKVLNELATRENAVLSLGGGAVVQEANRRLMRSDAASDVVWLTAPPNVLLERMNADSANAANRPALTPLPDLAEIEHLLKIRAPWYRECATLEVETTNKNPATVADEIFRHFGF